MSAQLLSHSEAAGHRPKAGLPDIDSADRDDPLAAAEYVVDIFSYWKRCEPMFRVGPEYMSRQVPCAVSLSVFQFLFMHLAYVTRLCNACCTICSLLPSRPSSLLQMCANGPGVSSGQQEGKKMSMRCSAHVRTDMFFVQCISFAVHDTAVCVRRAVGHQRQNARHPGRLARGGPSEVQGAIAAR